MENFDPRKILGADWTSRKNYCEAMRVWVNYIAGTSLVNLFSSDAVWRTVKSNMFNKYNNSAGTVRLQCSVQQLVSEYLRTAWDMGNKAVIKAYNNREYPALFKSINRKKNKTAKSTKSHKNKLYKHTEYPVSSQDSKDNKMTDDEMMQEFNEIFNK